jgi:hypothetical protein
MRTRFDHGRAAIGLLITFGLVSAQTPALAVPFTKAAYCTWHAKEPGAIYDRVAIEQGDHLMIVIQDPVFRSWGDSVGNTVELSTNHSSRRVRIRDAWTDVVPQLSLLGGYLNANARRMLGGAKSVQLWKRGELLVDVPLENTPSTKQLNACVPRNSHDDEAEEH